MLELCKKYGSVIHKAGPLWELRPISETEKRPRFQKITNFKSKTGQNLVVKQLKTYENGKYVL